jgi:hypothetical protein
VTLPGGLRLAALAIAGTDAAPMVAIVGPDGKRIETATDPGSEGVQGPGYVIVRSAEDHTTYALLGKPAAGTWRVEPLAGSSAISTVRSIGGTVSKSGISSST